MFGTAYRTLRGGRDQQAAAGSPASLFGQRRPWWISVVPFAIVLTVLLVRNSFIFSTPIYEDADMGANSILIEQARRWSLLVGEYSREKFSHPGPAYLYVESWGESLFWSAWHVVPTAWNGQLIAVYALDAFFAALVVAVGYGWLRSLRGAFAVFAVVLLFAAMHPAMFSSSWLPYMYIPAYFVFLVATASVVAGRLEDLWIATIAGWFCIHGSAAFLFFVPGVVACAVAAMAFSRRHRLKAAALSFLRGQRRAWVPSLVISAVFLLPMVLELILHWPGYYPQYFGYGVSSSAGGHSIRQDLLYMQWYWWPHAHAWAVILLAWAAGIAATWWCPAGPVRRVCVSLIAFDAISSVLMFVYAAIGIDEINQHYIGYFYWTAPALMLLVIVLGVLARLSETGGSRILAHGLTAVVLAAAVTVGTMFATAPMTRTTTAHTDPGDPSTVPDADAQLPAALTRLNFYARGKPIVLLLKTNTWPEATGLLVQAERTGLTACIAVPNMEFMVTSQFTCTQPELKNGVSFWLWPLGSNPKAQGFSFVFRLRQAIVSWGVKKA